ncbi:MAG: glycosyltransferase [Patescibacteria group bacterium]
MEKKEMKISVISTTYNRKDLLKQTIESVQKSIVAPLDSVEFEHIIYDDASTDGTEELFKDNPWKNVKYIRGEENKGPSYGRNRAIEACTGDYIFLIDSDDIILQRTLHNFAICALEHPQTQWFVSSFLHVDNDLKYIVGDDYYTWNFKDTHEMLTAIFKGEHFIQSSVFFTKDIFFKAGMFDENLSMGEDLDFFIRVLLLDEMPKFEAFISHLHRFHTSNLSDGITKEKHLKQIDFFREKYSAELAKAQIKV